MVLVPLLRLAPIMCILLDQAAIKRFLCGKRYLLAGITYFLSYAICELPVWAYFHAAGTMTDAQIAQGFSLAKIGLIFYSQDGAFLGKQVLILLTGILLYSLSWVLTFRQAAKQFEKYDM